MSEHIDVTNVPLDVPPPAPTRASIRRDNQYGIRYGFPLTAEPTHLERMSLERGWLRPVWVRQAGLTESERAPYEQHRMRKDDAA